MKSLSSSKVNSTKLLGGSSFSSKKTSVSSNKLKTSGENDFSIIKKQVFQIKNLITNITLSKKNEQKRKQKEQEQEKFEGTEKKLEKKKPKETGIKLPSTPKLGFLDRIKNFLFNTFLGFIAVRLIEHLPKLIGVAKFLGGTLDFLTSVGGTLLNGLVTFVEKGYEVADFTRKQLRNFGGEGAVEKFDALNKAFENIIFAAIAASLALGNLGSGGEKGGGPGGKPARRGFDTTGRRVGVNTQKRFAEKYGRDEFIKRFGKDNLKNLPKSMQRSALTKFGRNAVVGALGKGGTKTALKVVAPLVRNIPLIGGVMEFVLSWMSGDPVGKAAFKGVGAGLGTWIGGALGSLIPIPGVGTAIGMWLGSAGGSKLAEVIYDKIFNSKNSPQKPQKSIKAAGGGSAPSTRGGRIVTGPAKRKITKARRTVKVQSTPIKPGASIGGEKQIEKVFPKSEKSGTVNPLGYIEDTYKKTSEAPYFGALMGIATKAVVGQKPSPIDYKNAAQGLSNWMNVTFSDEVLRTGALAAAGGGQINAEMLSKSSGDMTNVIAKSLEENISKKVDDAINDLMKQMMLKPNIIEKEKPPGQEPGVDMGGGGSATDAIGGARLFMAQGFPMLAAAILAGNVQAESAWKGQRTPWVLNDGAGTNKGLISWNRSRIVNGEKFLGKPLETASNAEQVRWIKEELRQYGLLDEFMDPNRTESQLKSDSYKYIGWGIEGDRWTQSARIFAALQKGEQGTFIPGEGRDVGTGGGTWRFGRTGRLSVEPGWSHAHFDSANESTLTRDMVPILKKMASSGLKPELANGSKILSGQTNDYYVNIVKSGIAQHTHRPGPRMDVNMPGFPLVPFPLNYSFYQSGGSGHAAAVPGSGKTQLFHMSKKPDGSAFHGRLVPKDGKYNLHKGEFVVDKDSVDLLGKDFIATINSIENTSQLKNKADSLINTISHIAGYEPGGQQEVVVEQPEPEIVYITTPVPIGGGVMVAGGSSGGSNFSEGLYERG